MKCEDCQGTGLENENKVCPNCDGFGKIGEDEVELPAKFEKIVKEKVIKVIKPVKVKKIKK
jgi:DnaJ-class molecular chaperone